MRLANEDQANAPDDESDIFDFLVGIALQFAEDDLDFRKAVALANKCSHVPILFFLLVDPVLFESSIFDFCSERKHEMERLCQNQILRRRSTNLHDILLIRFSARLKKIRQFSEETAFG